MGGRNRPEPPEILTTPKAPRIVVIGAGFGGLWAVRRFVSHGIGVTLIDRNNYHTFLPLLYQVAAAELGPSEIAYPVRSLFRKHRLVDFRMANVHGIDLDARLVEADEASLDYDYLVMAPGSSFSPDVKNFISLSLWSFLSRVVQGPQQSAASGDRGTCSRWRTSNLSR